MIAIIIVVSWKGHHPSYCGHFIRACASFSEKIYVICPKQADPVGQLENRADLAAKTVVLGYANQASKSGFLKFQDIRADFREIRALVESTLQANPGKKAFIFHTSLDCLFIGIGQLPLLFFNIRKLFPWPFSGWLLAPDRRWPLNKPRQYLAGIFGKSVDQGSGMGMLHAVLDGAITVVANGVRWYYLWLKGLVLRRSSCGKIALLDERYLASLGHQTGKRIVCLPDITSIEVSDPSPELVGRISRLKQGSVVVGLLGELSRRKGLHLLLDVLQYQDTDGLFFVIAGACDPGSLSVSQRAFLEKGINERKNVIFSPGSIPSESDFNAIVNCCDLLYCVYQDHLHSSNVISKAAAFRKPVLVTSGELMAKRVEDYQMGAVLTERTSEACIKALRRMGSPEYLKNIQVTAQFTRYMKDQSVEKLNQVVASLAVDEA